MNSQVIRRSRRHRRRQMHVGRIIVITILVLAVIGLSVLLFNTCSKNEKPLPTDVNNTQTPVSAETPALTAQAQPTVAPVPEFNPAPIEGTRPSDFGFEESIEDNGTQTTNYRRENPIDFMLGESYTELEGIITFRGNNFRDSPSYGTVDLSVRGNEPWKFSIGSMSKVSGDGSWSGCGWTGQPLIVKWPEETKKIMNLTAEAKNDPNLVEVIYATMDGRIYFFDLYTGKATRSPINMGYPFKGAGALDPRGYPLMYVGSGDDSPKEGKGSSRAFIINLIDGSILYEFGSHEGFALRNLSYFDSSALVDAKTDTLIYPGESGVLYTIKLNTDYNPSAGTIFINPHMVKWRYKGSRNLSTATADGSQGWWLGIEDSAIIWRGHAIFSENGGHLICLDLNTLKTVWVQDTLDDTNCTPVLSLEGTDQHPYVYISTSFHPGWRENANSRATVPIWKIDALNGKIVAQNNDYKCQTISKPHQVSGGVQGTPAIGENNLSGLLFVPISMTDGMKGKLVAFNTSDMSVKWECNFMGYPWSSPVPVYDKDGNGYICQCNLSGYIHLINGLTGEIINEMSLGSNIEASPAIYNNMVVVGTRGGRIYGVDLAYLKDYVKPSSTPAG